MSSTRWQISLPFSNSENQSEMKKNADNPIFFLSIICKKTRYFVCLATKKLPIGEPSILTLVERQTRYAVTKKLVEKKAEYVNQAVLECMKLYPVKSITADNGNEFSSLSKIEGLDVYFAHAYSSYERGTNENFNGLLREFIPKGCSLKELNQNLLEDYTKAINERPRRIHGYQSAKKLFELTQTA